MLQLEAPGDVTTLLTAASPSVRETLAQPGINEVSVLFPASKMLLLLLLPLPPSSIVVAAEVLVVVVVIT